MTPVMEGDRADEGESDPVIIVESDSSPEEKDVDSPEQTDAPSEPIPDQVTNESEFVSSNDAWRGWVIAASVAGVGMILGFFFVRRRQAGAPLGGTSEQPQTDGDSI
jgi:hypothetical protein